MIPAVVVNFGGGAAPAGPSRPVFVFTLPLAGKIVGGMACALTGLYYLASGKESASVKKMVLGAALVFAALFFF